ncbi:MAG: PKD domain-containing protein, partial [Thermoanaerobaculia bacterium]
DTHSILWRVERGAARLAEGSGASFSFTPADDGVYRVTLTVTDNDGGSGSAAASLTVLNRAPRELRIDGSLAVEEGKAAALTAAFLDAAADTHGFRWQVAAANGQSVAEGTGPGFGFTPFDDGLYLVSLTVTDDDGGSARATAEVRAENAAPSEFRFQGETSIEVGQLLELEGSFLDAPGDSFRARADFGDGFLLPVEVGPGRVFTLEHLYASEGSYTVRVTVTDDDGGAATASVAVVVADASAVLALSNLLATSGGIAAWFTKRLDLSALNLFDAPDGSLGPPDVEVQRAGSAPLPGSLAVNRAGNQLQWIATGGPLAPGDYTARLRSGARGFKDLSGRALDGDGDGQPGGDAVLRFTVGPSSAAVVGLPD